MFTLSFLHWTTLGGQMARRQSHVGGGGGVEHYVEHLNYNTRHSLIPIRRHATSHQCTACFYLLLFRLILFALGYFTRGYFCLFPIFFWVDLKFSIFHILSRIPAILWSPRVYSSLRIVHHLFILVHNINVMVWHSTFLNLLWQKSNYLSSKSERWRWSPSEVSASPIIYVSVFLLPKRPVKIFECSTSAINLSSFEALFFLIPSLSWSSLWWEGYPGMGCAQAATTWTQKKSRPKISRFFVGVFFNPPLIFFLRHFFFLFWS